MTSPASDSLKEIIARLDQRIQSVDEERWLSSRYAKSDARETLIVLYAFSYELARVRLVVTDQTMGSIRFQWWRDALGELGQDTPRQHDVVLALAEQIRASKLDLSDLKAMVDQHEAAYLNQDRALEPEAKLIEIAIVALAGDPSEFGAIASQWATLRRGEVPDQIAPKVSIPTTLRPAVAHLRLRHAWQKGQKLSPLQKRLSVLCAMLTGRV